MAKLHSLVARIRPPACRSSSRVPDRRYAGRCAWSITGVILPSSFMAGGKSVVMNRLEPFLLSISRSRSYMNLVDWSLSIFHRLQLRPKYPETYRRPDSLRLRLPALAPKSAFDATSPASRQGCSTAALLCFRVCDTL